MSYVMTKYFYPLPKEGSPRFGDNLYFDNPRNSDEINTVASILKKSNYASMGRVPEEEYQVGPDYLTLRSLFEDFIENNNDKPDFVSFGHKHSNEKDIYKIWAKMWVILRYDDEHSLHLKERDIKLHKIMQKDNSPETLLTPYYRMLAHMCFLDFMCLPDENVPRSIIWDPKLEENEFADIFSRIAVVSNIEPSRRKKMEYPICTFDLVLKEYQKINNLIAHRYDDNKFLFIANTLLSASEFYIFNENMYNISLCSIIEMLLTHKPDNNRFNIEESISKQFVGKLTYLLYENDNKIDVEKTKKELKLAYSLRSDIAHGNYDTITQTQSKLYKLYDFHISDNFLDSYSLDDTIEHLNQHLISYLRIVLKTYLKNEKKLDILKSV